MDKFEDAAPSPAFSVVIPCYNRAASVLSTLQSVQGQTYSDFECIIVDDGSNDSDALQAVIRGLRDSRFKYVHRPNGGGGAARNTGIDAAQGRFIAFLDSDDRFLPGKLDQDHRTLVDDERARLVLFSQVQVDRGNGATWIKPRRAPRPTEPISEYLTCGQGFVQTSTVVIQRDFAKTVRFTEGLPFGQDTDFAMRLAAEGATFEMHETPLVVWNDGQDVGRISAKPKHLPMMTWIEAIRPVITERAYLAYRGWHIARLAAPHDRMLSFKLYFIALFRGALPPKLALTAFAQIIVPRSEYRRIANLVAKYITPKTAS